MPKLSSTLFFFDDCTKLDGVVSGHGQGATQFVYLIFESTCLMGCGIEFRGLIFQKLLIDTKAVASLS